MFDWFSDENTAWSHKSQIGIETSPSHMEAETNSVPRAAGARILSLILMLPPRIKTPGPA